MTTPRTPTPDDAAREDPWIVVDGVLCDCEHEARFPQVSDFQRAFVESGITLAGPGMVVVSEPSVVIMWNTIWQMVLARTATAELIEVHKELSSCIGLIAATRTAQDHDGEEGK
jgi:hypothetical protein